MRALSALAIVVFAPVAFADSDATAIAPPCANPARLENQFDGIAGVWVGFKPSTVNPHAAGLALSKKYGFKIEGYGFYWKGFIVSFLAPTEVAALRCEPDVEFVTYNLRAHIT